MKHKIAIVIGILALTGLTVGAFYARRGEAPPDLVTAVVSRGSIVTEIAATGTLEAVTTVEVGSQVSGTIQSLGADFNSIVRKGQVIARLDPSQYQTQVDSARATVASAGAQIQNQQIVLADAETKLARARELAAKQLIAATDLQTAEVAQRSASAQLRGAQAQLAQAKASLTQAEVNLQKTVIASPIDGIVIGRTVDAGQTVAASLQAPTLFTIAADLKEMQVNTNIDESDLGAIQEGQEVSFRVDAYPTRTFKGVVEQVRLNPVITQNVVTYAAIISAQNPTLELKPGMTANVTIEVARREDVLRVPAAALRFRPTDETLAALGGQQAAAKTARPASDRTAKAGTGTVWVLDGALHPVSVNTGVSDGVYTEVLGGTVNEGMAVATRLNAPAAKAAQTTASSPLMPQQGPPRRF